MHFHWATCGVSAEVRVWQHRDNRCVIEETNCFVGQFGDINQCFRIGMTVNQCVCQEVSTFLGVQDMHGTEVFEARLDADHFFCHFDRIAISCIKTGDECICIACFHHHHTEVVAFEHLVVGFFVGKSFACTFFCKDAGVTLATVWFVRVTKIDDFNTFQTKLHFFCQFSDSFVVS